MYRIATSLVLLVTIATGAKLTAERNAAPAAAKQPGASEFRTAEIRTVQTADTSQVAGTSARSENAAPAPSPLPAWLEDPSVMDGSWRKWPSLTDF
jgi:hypothetical protein